ncbi:MAG: hydrogenase maturation nickel metallochaperone HypA [Nitrospirae bacterium]|nr:hydrogenase maturation nickel metallochaperone HypA [Nitrospirota bacterium]
MHELSIAASILDIAVKTAEDRSFSSINLVRVRIGRGAGVLPDSLTFAFGALKESTIASNAELIVENVPLTGSCGDCLRDFESDTGYVLGCPLCGSGSIKIKSGYEMDLIDIEVDD